MNTLKISVRRHISVESCVIFLTPIGCGLGRDHPELDLVEVQFIPVSPNKYSVLSYDNVSGRLQGRRGETYERAG